MNVQTFHGLQTGNLNQRSRILPRAHPITKTLNNAFVVLFSLALIIASFIPVTMPGDALSSALDPNRAREILLLVAGILLIWTQVRSQNLLHITVNNPTFLIVGIFVSWALLSFLWSPAPLLTIARSCILFVLVLHAALTVTVVARYMTFSEEFAKLLTQVLMVILGFCLVSNIILWGTPLPMLINLPPTPLGELEAWEARPRFLAGYAHPLVIADIMSLAIICLFVSDFRKRLKILIAPFFITILWLTDGRAATGSLLIALVVISFIQIKRLDIRVWLVGLFLLSLLGYAVFFNLWDAGSQIWGQDWETLNGRMGLWSEVLPLILAKPLLGYGYFASRYLTLDIFDWAGQTHNSFLEILLTTGLVGFALLAAFTGYLIYMSIKTKNRLLIGVGVFCYIDGMFNPLLFYPSFSMFILLLCLMQSRLLTSKAVRAQIPGFQASPIGRPKGPILEPESDTRDQQPHPALRGEGQGSLRS